MSILLYGIILSLGAGLSAFFGALLARAEHFRPNWLENELRHGIMAFGGGALLAAVALVLIPDGMEMQPAALGIGSFLTGAIVFMGLDWYLARRNTSISQMIAMMLDFVPEAIVLGAVIESNFKQAIFMAVIIAAQNFPEGFNAYREMRASKMAAKWILGCILIAACLGPFFMMGGLYIFPAESVGLGMLMTFCGGGILYIVFNDIAPQAKMKNYWLPSLGAVLGFMVGMIGHALT